MGILQALNIKCITAETPETESRFLPLPFALAFFNAHWVSDQHNPSLEGCIPSFLFPAHLFSHCTTILQFSWSQGRHCAVVACLRGTPIRPVRFGLSIQGSRKSMNELTHTDQWFIFVARPVCIPMACRRLQLCSLTLERLCEQTLLSHNRPPR